jgi:tRNA G10  N-methylase Trm11
MHDYFVQLGSTTELAFLELVSSVDASKLLRHDSFVLGVASTDEGVDYLVETLGGVVKGGELLKTYLEGWQREDIVNLLAEEIVHNDYLKFGLSFLGNTRAKDYNGLVRSVKDKVRLLSGKRVGYVLPKRNETTINAAQFKHIIESSNGVEFLIYFGKTEVYVGIVTAVQPIDLWSEFDFGRPDRRIHEGMLPAKVARMMLNIAIGKRKRLGIEEQSLQILDPFCGSGTVLSEALRLGYSVLGLDNSREAVDSAQRNLNWTKTRLINYPKSRLQLPVAVDYANLRFEVAYGDAAHVAEVFPGRKIDIVVTEPYMGPLFHVAPDLVRAKNVVKGLQKLYLGFFKSLARILSEQSVIVFVVPIIRSSEGPELEVNIIDRLREFGYTLVEKGVVYSRLDSVVKRKIVVFCYGTR